MHLCSVPWLSTLEQSYTSLLSICKGSLSVWGWCECPIHYHRLKDVLWQHRTFRWQYKLLQLTSVVNFTVRLNSWGGCTMFTQATVIWPLNHPQPYMSVPWYQLWHWDSFIHLHGHTHTHTDLYKQRLVPIKEYYWFHNFWSKFLIAFVAGCHSQRTIVLVIGVMLWIYANSQMNITAQVFTCKTKFCSHEGDWCCRKLHHIK